MAFAAVALLLSPLFWISLRDLIEGVPDESFASTAWSFQAEVGQHLAWADAVLNGDVPGRDFFMLYGPLWPLGGAAAFWVLGRSIATWSLYYASLNLVAIAAALLLAARVTRRPFLVLALPFVALPVCPAFWGGLELRYGLALAGLWCLSYGIEKNSQRWIAAAGATGGVAILFSQEFAVAFLLCAFLALAVLARWSAMLALIAGVVAASGPCLAWLAWAGALGPMLRDLSGYPGLVMAGFGKLPFPSAVAALPISPRQLIGTDALDLRLGYAVPAVCWAALMWSLGVGRFDLLHPIDSMRVLRRDLVGDPRRLTIGILALFGLLAFRYALGRSALQNTIRITGAASVLIFAGAAGALETLRREPLLSGWRALALCGVLAIGGFSDVAITAARSSLETVGRMMYEKERVGVVAVGRAEALAVVGWVDQHVDAADAVLFLPNHAAYYFLTGHQSPIRFVLGHQMATHAQRQEALEQLRARPPRFIVYVRGTQELDGIPHEEVLGADITNLIHAEYEVAAEVGPALILEHLSHRGGGLSSSSTH